MAPLSPPETDGEAEDIPPYLANGVVGIRVGPLPFGGGVCISSGLAGIFPGDRVEGFARAPYPLAGDLEVDGYRLAAVPALVRRFRRRYDFERGELTTRFEYGPPGGATARAEVLTFCSRSMPSLVLQELTVSVDRACQLVLTVGVDPTDIGGRWLERETVTPGTTQPVVDGWMHWETYGGLSTCGAAYTTVFEGADAQRSVDYIDELAPLRTTYRVEAMPGSTYRLRQITSIVNSQFHSHPHRQATRMAAAGTEVGFDSLRRANAAAWEDLWRSRVRLVGADQRWQAIADAAFYYLHASAHPSSLFSTSMFGLAYWPNYHYYSGHVMWDIEAFAFPPLLLVQPDAARGLLEYRFERTAAAQRNAAMNGYAGLQFPWASGPLAGEETIRTNAPLISFEQHVTPGVAQAFAQFVHVTGDLDFLRERAWPVVQGVARWIESRGRPAGEGFEIPEALGIAEQAEPADNDVYMNMACAQALREAAQVARALGRYGDAARWERRAGEIVLPRADDGTLLHHDGFTYKPRDPTSATPEVTAGVLLFGYPLTAEERGHAIALELDRVDPYLGHPMLSAPLGAAAAWLGDRARSAELFEAGYGEFIRGPYLETDEYNRRRYPERPHVGPFMANIGGFLSACLYWLPRLRPSAAPPTGWLEGPVVMPELWEAIEVDRLLIQGREAGLRARHGAERADLELS